MNKICFRSNGGTEVSKSTPLGGLSHNETGRASEWSPPRRSFVASAASLCSPIDSKGPIPQHKSCKAARPALAASCYGTLGSYDPYCCSNCDEGAGRTTSLLVAEGSQAAGGSQSRPGAAISGRDPVAPIFIFTDSVL